MFESSVFRRLSVPFIFSIIGDVVDSRFSMPVPGLAAEGRVSASEGLHRRVGLSGVRALIDGSGVDGSLITDRAVSV